MNRTAVIRELRERGSESAAKAYEGFYLAGWEGFRSRFRDGDAARAALLSLDALFREARGLVGAKG